mgnify:CR=1 FL=1
MVVPFVVSTQKARRNARKKIDKLVDYAKDYGQKDWLTLQSMKMER